MGLMDKFLGYMKLGDDEDDGYYDDEYDDYDEAPVEKNPKSRAFRRLIPMKKRNAQEKRFRK